MTRLARGWKCGARGLSGLPAAGFSCAQAIVDKEENAKKPNPDESVFSI